MKRWIWMIYLAGCSTTLIGKAEDENPFTKPDHISEGIIIPFKDAQIISNAGEAVGDPGQEGYASRNSNDGNKNGTAQYMHPTFHDTAYFQAPNPDQVIFIIEIQSRWRELTHAEAYEVTLSDDQGHKFLPTDVTSTMSRQIWAGMVLGRTDVKHMTVYSSTAPGGAWEFKHGEASQDTGDNKSMMAARSRIEFRGNGIVTPKTKRVVLRLYNRNRSLEFVWNFK